MLSHPTETTGTIVVQSTATTSVWKVGMRIDLLRESVWRQDTNSAVVAQARAL
jgi:hypothetical protein